MPLTTSPSVLGACVNGEDQERAWQTFQQIYQPLIAKWVRELIVGADPNIVEETVVDLQSMVFEKFRNGRFNLSRRERRGGFRKWLRTVIQNWLIDQHRRRKDRPKIFDLAVTNDEAVVRSLVNDWRRQKVKEIANEVAGLYKTELPEWQQMVISELGWNDGRRRDDGDRAPDDGTHPTTSVKEIAAKLDKTPQVISVALSNARKELRRRVLKELEEHGF